MSVDEKLYDLLVGDREIPWGYAAGQFLMVKVASGGLYPDDAEEVCKVVLAASREESPEDKTRKAYEQGMLSGLRSIPAGDIAMMGRMRRTRGARIGDIAGAGAGLGAGLLATRGGSPTSKAIAAILGTTLGKTVGKNIGAEIDTARAKSRFHSSHNKTSSIEKRSEAGQGGIKERVKGVLDRLSPTQRSALLGAGAGSLIGSGYSGLAIPMIAGRKARDLETLWGEKNFARHSPEVQKTLSDQFARSSEYEKGIMGLAAKGDVGAVKANEINRMGGGYGPVGRTMTGALVGAAIGAMAGAGVQKMIDNRKERAAGIQSMKLTPSEQKMLAAHRGTSLQKTSSINRVYRVLLKHAQNPSGDPTITSPVVPMPSESPLLAPGGDQPLHPAIEAQLQQLQQQNESEFYRQQAEEAKQEADQGRQRVEELIQQLNMLNQQSQQQMAQDQQVRQMSEQQAQMASQDAMSARNESLQAQQQNMQLRTAVTQFRQALMNLVAQDPTMMMGPPQVQTGPMPPQPGAEQAPQAGVPEGAAPEAVAQGAAPPEAAGQPPAQGAEQAGAAAPAPAAGGQAAPMTPPQAPEMMTPPPPPAGGAPAAPAAM